MKAITILETNDNKKLNKQFIDVPWKLYDNEPSWVPPLKMAVKDQLNPKHPFYEIATIKTWLAAVDGEIVGRIAAFVNHKYNEIHNTKCGFFGFFESTEDEDVAHALLHTAETYLKEQGMEKLQGPVNMSANYEIGALVEGFDDPPQIMMLYNPKWHMNMYEKEGYAKAMDLLAYQMPLANELPGVIKRIAEKVSNKPNITFRQVSKKDWANEVNRMHDIYNSAWEKNWGFTPMTDAEFKHTAKDLKSVVDERLVLFVEVDGEPAGFIVALPDFNQVMQEIPSGKLLPTGIFKILNAKKYMTRMRVITLGVKAKFRKMGLETLLYVKCQENGLKAGYDEVEMSWVLEDNLEMNKPLIRMGGKPYKTYRVYEKEL